MSQNSLSGSSRKAAESLAEVLIPSEPERPGALDRKLVDRLFEWIGAIRGAGTVVVLLCWFWEFSPLLSFRAARLSSLALSERTALLERWENSRLLVRRYALFMTRGLFMAAFYNDPEVWPLIGYEPGCLSEPPRAVETDGGGTPLQGEES